MTTRFPNVDVQLTGSDGNAFAIIGAVAKGLRRAGETEAATEFSNNAMDCGSYDELLQLAMATVNVS